MNQKNTADVHKMVLALMNDPMFANHDVMSMQEAKRRFRVTLRTSKASPGLYMQMIEKNATLFTQDFS